MKRFKKFISTLFAYSGYQISRIGNAEEVYWSGLSSAEIRRLFHFDCFNKTLNLDGVYVECGVGNGSTLILMSNLLEEYKSSKKIWAFDSFEGFPDPSHEDGNFFASNFARYNDEYTQYSLDFVKKNILSVSCNKNALDRMEFIKGVIPDSLKAYDESKISLMNLDLDIYKSSSDALDFFWPHLQDGGIIMLDEYEFGKDLDKWPGAKKAIDEFCKKKNIQVNKHFTGRYFLKKLSNII